MITQRRVFQAKSGSSGAVVAKMKEFQPIFERAGGPTARIYTDFFSGATDRVVWEFDVDSLTALENVFWAPPRMPNTRPPTRVGMQAWRLCWKARRWSSGTGRIKTLEL